MCPVLPERPELALLCIQMAIDRMTANTASTNDEDNILTCPVCGWWAYEWEWAEHNYICNCGRSILDYEEFLVWVKYYA